MNGIMFSENDMLYILGYVVDRGPEPVEVLLNMMKRKNVIFVLGNHDYLMYAVMKKVLNSLKNNINLTEEERALYKLWIEYGGLATEEGFLNLNSHSPFIASVAVGANTSSTNLSKSALLIS